MSKESEHGTVRVLVTSVDGNFAHPFQKRATIGDVKAESYKRLVQNKDQVPQDSTWVELDTRRLDESTTVGSLVGDAPKNPGSEIDLTLSLAWTSQGG